MSNKAFDTFEQVFITMRRKSAGIITTKTASEIASQIAVGLFSPLAERIDPSWIGQLQMSIDVALHYWARLGMDIASVKTLIEQYPSHSFVIDYREATELFDNVRLPKKGELLLYDCVLET